MILTCMEAHTRVPIALSVDFLQNLQTLSCMQKASTLDVTLDLQIFS